MKTSDHLQHNRHFSSAPDHNVRVWSTRLNAPTASLKKRRRISCYLSCCSIVWFFYLSRFWDTSLWDFWVHNNTEWNFIWSDHSTGQISFREISGNCVLVTPDNPQNTVNNTTTVSIGTTFWQTNAKQYVLCIMETLSLMECLSLALIILIHFSMVISAEGRNLWWIAQNLSA